MFKVTSSTDPNINLNGPTPGGDGHEVVIYRGNEEYEDSTVPRPISQIVRDNKKIGCYVDGLQEYNNVGITELQTKKILYSFNDIRQILLNNLKNPSHLITVEPNNDKKTTLDLTVSTISSNCGFASEYEKLSSEIVRTQQEMSKLKIEVSSESGKFTKYEDYCQKIKVLKTLLKVFHPFEAESSYYPQMKPKLRPRSVDSWWLNGFTKVILEKDKKEEENLESSSYYYLFLSYKDVPKESLKFINQDYITFRNPLIKPENKRLGTNLPTNDLILFNENAPFICMNTALNENSSENLKKANIFSPEDLEKHIKNIDQKLRKEHARFISLYLAESETRLRNLYVNMRLVNSTALQMMLEEALREKPFALKTKKT